MTTLAIILGLWLLVSVIAGLLIGRGIKVLSSEEPRGRHANSEVAAIQPSSFKTTPAASDKVQERTLTHLPTL